MDVIGIYLKSLLDQKAQPIYIKIPQRFGSGQEWLVCKILKSLYSLKQAGRLWNKTIIRFFQKIKFVLTNANLCMLTYRQGDVFIIMKVYVNDLLLRSQSQDELEWLKDRLIKKFNMKDLGKAKTIIRWGITQNLQARTLKID